MDNPGEDAVEDSTLIFDGFCLLYELARESTKDMLLAQTPQNSASSFRQLDQPRAGTSVASPSRHQLMRMIWAGLTWQQKDKKVGTKSFKLCSSHSDLTPLN